MLFIERNKREQSFGYLYLLLPAISCRDDFDSNAYRSAAAPFQRRVDRDDIAEQDRRDEFHFFDGDRRGRALCDPPGNNAARLIHHAQYPTAEDMAVGIDVGGAGDDSKDRIAAAW